jgi:hypothetical protein
MAMPAMVTVVDLGWATDGAKAASGSLLRASP